MTKKETYVVGDGYRYRHCDHYYCDHVGHVLLQNANRDHVHGMVVMVVYVLLILSVVLYLQTHCDDHVPCCCDDHLVGGRTLVGSLLVLHHLRGG